MSKRPLKPDTRSIGQELAKRATQEECRNGALYKSPSLNDTVDLGHPITVLWDASCMNPAPQRVNIFLYAPAINPSKEIHAWEVDYASGTAKLDDINPIWFNKTATAKMYFQIMAPGDANTPPIFNVNNQAPPGPFFNTIYDATKADIMTASGNTANNGTVTVVNNLYKPSGMTKGQIAAAVIMPILVVAACIAGYVFYSRKKEAIKRKEYRENLDQRMSVAPGSNWAPISAAGASAAIRHSMAASHLDRNTRASSFFGRPDSTFDDGQEMRQTRRGVTSTYDSEGYARTSRVSFAEPTKPLNLNRPAVPPLPAAYRKSTFGIEEETASPDQANLSPTQREGAFVLDDDSIRDRLSGASPTNGRASVMDLGADSLPALAMMRTNDLSPTNDDDDATSPNTAAPMLPAPVLTREEGFGDYKTYSIGAYSGNTDSMIVENTTQGSYFGNTLPQSSDPDEALRIYASRNPQTPAAVTASPFSGFAAGPTLAAAAGFDMSSPDAIFRAYAATRPAAPPTVATVSSPSAMRTLYNSTMTQGLGLRERAGTVSSAGDKNPYRDSMAPSAYSEEVGKAR